MKENIIKPQMILPDGHALNNYKKQFKLYDRFLPELVKFINDGIIIDVGANVGDTLYSIIYNCENEIYCFEPSDIFYSYLEKNVNELPIELRNRVKIFNEFIGSNDLKGELLHDNNGTAKIINNINTKNIFNQIDNLELNKTISLLKIDTDGYDYDVINSSLKIIKRDEPILFWENFVENEVQFENYNKMYDKLQLLGYDSFYVFDNFGNIMLRDVNVSTILSMNLYLKSLNLYNCSRTIYYFDILCTTNRNKESIMSAIKHYSENFIFNDPENYK